MIARLQENPIQLQQVADGFGWSRDDQRVAVVYRSPKDVYIDEWVYEPLAVIDRTAAKRVLIDSLSDLQCVAPDPVRFRKFIYSLMQRLSRAAIAPIMTSEIPDTSTSAAWPNTASRTLRQRHPAAVSARRITLLRR